MRSFVKVWLGIAFAAIGFGLVLMVIAAANGMRLADVTIFNIGRRYDNSYFDTNRNDNDVTNGDNSYNGSTNEDHATYTYDEKYEDVESLNFEIGYGDITIEEGDEFSIQGKNFYNEEFESYVEDGIWYISQDSSDHGFFGIDIAPEILFGDYKAPVIVITIPNDVSLKECYLDLGAGRLEAEKLTAETGNFSVGAGELVIDQLVVLESSEYDVGTGKLEINEMSAQDIYLDCGVGNVNIKGRLTGENTVSCGIGEVVLDLEGNEDEYSYQIDCGIGSVIINNESYHGIIEQRSDTKELENHFDLDCGIGKIELKIN
ncbi:MAG: hypothetical protein K0S47_1819 [Herbinix sp.]|jgi:hypothetical protein|nr:hypothetical protein [Herbinix sp.]